MEQPQHIVFFDGVCNSCNSIVNFLLDHDKHQRLVFASLQGETYQHLRTQHPELPEDVSSIVLFSNGNMFTRSTAALKIALALGGIWRLFAVFLLVPEPVRDLFYTYYSRNRYKWFGKSEMCRVPTAELRMRFLV